MYKAYLSTGEILECDNFKTIFKACRLRVREEEYSFAFIYSPVPYTGESCICSMTNDPVCGYYVASLLCHSDALGITWRSGIEYGVARVISDDNWPVNEYGAMVINRIIDEREG